MFVVQSFSAFCSTQFIRKAHSITKKAQNLVSKTEKTPQASGHRSFHAAPAMAMKLNDLSSFSLLRNCFAAAD
jgi:hypothetical protein